jgi:hypothetical protein
MYFPGSLGTKASNVSLALCLPSLLGERAFAKNDDVRRSRDRGGSGSPGHPCPGW